MPYIKDTDFLLKLKNLNKVPDIGIMVTGNIAGLFTNIPHNKDPEILKKQLDSFDEKSIPRKDWVKMTESVLKNNYFEFNSNVKHQLSGTAIGTKFAPPYIYTYIWTL